MTFSLASLGISWMIAAPLLVAGVLCMGFLIARWIWVGSPRAWCLAASPIVGAAVASVWLDLAARYVSWDFATAVLWLVGTELILIFISHLIGARKRWKLTAPVWCVIIIFIALFMLVLAGGVFYDAPHFATQAIMANGVWPVPYFYSPDQPLLYHY